MLEQIQPCIAAIAKGSDNISDLSFKSNCRGDFNIRPGKEIVGKGNPSLKHP